MVRKTFRTINVIHTTIQTTRHNVRIASRPPPSKKVVQKLHPDSSGFTLLFAFNFRRLNLRAKQVDLFCIGHNHIALWNKVPLTNFGILISGSRCSSVGLCTKKTSKRTCRFLSLSKSFCFVVWIERGKSHGRDVLYCHDNVCSWTMILIITEI